MKYNLKKKNLRQNYEISNKIYYQYNFRLHINQIPKKVQKTEIYIIKEMPCKL